MEIWKFWRGPGIYLCCCNYGCYDNTVGKGGRAAVGGYWGVVMKEPHYVLPVLEWEMMKMVNDVMDEWRCHASWGLLCSRWDECIVAANDDDGWSTLVVPWTEEKWWSVFRLSHGHIVWRGGNLWSFIGLLVVDRHHHHLLFSSPSLLVVSPFSSHLLLSSHLPSTCGQ